MLKSDKKAPVPKKVQAYEPENIHLTKAEFVAKRNKQKERDALISAAIEKIDSGETKVPGLDKIDEKPEAKTVPPVEHTLQKPKGRPKKK